MLWWNVVWDSTPVDLAFHNPWIVMLVEVLRAKKKWCYIQDRCLFLWKWTTSPSSMEEAQPSQHATKLRVGLLKKESILGAQSSPMLMSRPGALNRYLWLMVWTFRSSIRGVSFGKWESVLLYPCIDSLSVLVATSFMCLLCCWCWLSIPSGGEVWEFYPFPLLYQLEELWKWGDHVHSSSSWNRLWY